MKKIISFILTTVLIMICAVPAKAYTYNSDTVTVYVTVNDITDIDNPLNTIVERQKLTVSNFDMSQYGESFTGLEIVDSGVTYLHVLIALHEKLYGRENVSANLKLDKTGVTRIFMGRSVGSIMYKNGNYIFAIPQYVTVRDGDEVNICLYDEGYNQAIASFDKSNIIADVNEKIDLSLYMHHWYPEFKETIQGANITDENGIFFTDEYGNLIETDENGDFKLSIPVEGTYMLTINPTVGYYMSQDGGTWVTWWEEVEQPGDIPGDTALGKAAKELSRVEGISNVSMVSWDDLPEFDSMGEVYDTYTEVFQNTKPAVKPEVVETHFDHTTQTINSAYKIPPYIELTEHKEFITGEASQKVDYTTPWVIVTVTDDFTVTGGKLTGKTLSLTAINPEAFNEKVICAAYNTDTDGGELLGEVKFVSAAEKMNVTFSDIYDIYRIYAWGSDMKPVTVAYTHKEEILMPSWDFTQPKPDNLIITGSVQE